MFPQPISEFEIRCDMAERQQPSHIDETGESLRWFHPTVTQQSNWLAIASNRLGRAFVSIGQQLQGYSLNAAPAPAK